MRRIKDSHEAVLSAICYMSFSPMVLFGFLDASLSRFADIPTLSDILGKWIYIVFVYGSIFFIHYVSLVRDGKYKQIIKSCDVKPMFDDNVGSLVVAAYFSVPVLLYLSLIIADRI